MIDFFTKHVEQPSGSPSFRFPSYAAESSMTGKVAAVAFIAWHRTCTVADHFIFFLVTKLNNGIVSLVSFDDQNIKSAFITSIRPKYITAAVIQ